MLTSDNWLLTIWLLIKNFTEQPGIFSLKKSLRLFYKF